MICSYDWTWRSKHTATIQVVLELHKIGLTMLEQSSKVDCFNLDDINYLETELDLQQIIASAKAFILNLKKLLTLKIQDIVDSTNACIDRMLEAGLTARLRVMTFQLLNMRRQLWKDLVWARTFHPRRSRSTA